MAEHTPTPWAADPIEKDVIVYRGGHVARCERRGPKEHGRMPQETLANAAFIVKAVNNHEALVRALEFYADPRRYNGANQQPIPDDPHAKPGAVYIQDVTRDGGSIAAAVLAAVRS